MGEVGAGLGDRVGVTDGTMVGDTVELDGASVTDDGTTVGSNEGTDAVGETLGTIVGVTLGTTVGVTVGGFKGTNVGVCVGTRVGVKVPTAGAVVGTADGTFVAVLALNEFAVHCIFVSATVGPHDDVPVA